MTKSYNESYIIEPYIIGHNSDANNNNIALIDSLIQALIAALSELRRLRSELKPDE